MSNTGRRGSVKQAANGTWYFIVDQPSNEIDEKGNPKRRQTRRRGFKTRREAQAKLTEILGSMATKTYVEPKRVTVGHFMTQVWLPRIRHTIKQSTYESYERVARLHTSERTIGARQLQQIDGGDLNDHYAVLLAGDKKHEPLGATTTRYCATVLHRAFKDAIRWKYLVLNPVDQSDPPSKGEAPEMVTWTFEEMATFLDVALEHRLGAAFWLLASTGARRGEILGLRWSDVDLEAGRASIRQTVLDQNVAPGWRIERSAKTKKSIRSIPLDAECVAALKQHRANQNRERLAVGEAWDDTFDLITCDVDGTPIRPRSVTDRYSRFIARHGLPHMKLHGLRHTYATHALKLGVHPLVVKEQLGHTRIQTTLDIYSHVDVSLLSDASQQIAAARRAAAKKSASGEAGQ